MSSEPSSNPFPGLRPFEADEDHLFFGRERETDELLRRLRSRRFLAVVGTSGSGKSSLVRCGLIPSLQSGFMVTAGSSWRVSVLRPGEDPIRHLAAALDAPTAIGGGGGELEATGRVLLEATLHRGTLGLVEAVRQARIPAGDNVLIVVDQFEELFRYRRTRQQSGATDEAVSFVKLLLEAAAQNEVAIYVALTMRSDFLGDCMEFPGLPEAVNQGLYLVPRMSRDNLRAAITGPVAVAGGEIEQRLVLRLLNETGDDPDRLPVLQHALMRTWDHWHARHRDWRPIDVEDYEAVGTLRTALSMHAEEAFKEAGDAQSQLVVERMFKALTDSFADPRGTRRPTSVAELSAVCGVDQAEVIRIVEIFRRPGRSFLTPPAGVPLSATSIVDLSHESLMRGWARLIGWAAEERQSASIYARVSQAATWWSEGSAGLWRNPELELGLRWRREARPTTAWARRYHEPFEEAMSFLDRSEREQQRIEAEREAERRRTLRRTQLAAGVLAVLLVMALLSTWWAWRENVRAERNLNLAREAVDEALSSASTDPALMGADVPELVTFRRDLMRKAERFYTEFVRQEPNSEAVLVDVAEGHKRLGHIQRILDDPAAAERHYRHSIHQLERLASERPSEASYRRSLADTYNWLGETLRPLAARAADAKSAYDRAIALQQQLAGERPENLEARRDLARTHYNRAILQSYAVTQPGDAAFAASEKEFRDAIQLLEPIGSSGADRPASQDLARVLNNLGSLLADDRRRLADVQQLYERATRLYEELTAADSGNREYALELATLDGNMADLLRRLGDPNRALRQNDRALGTLRSLSNPAPSVGIAQADGYTLRGRILELVDPTAALEAYSQSYRLFEALERREHVGHAANFEWRFVDLLVNLAAFVRARPALPSARALLLQASGSYFKMAREIVMSGTPSEVQSVNNNVTRLWRQIADPDRRALLEPYRELQRQLQKRTADPKSPPAPSEPHDGRDP